MANPASAVRAAPKFELRFRAVLHHISYVRHHHIKVDPGIVLKGPDCPDRNVYAVPP
jgi:hypothetical protein